MIWRKQAGRSTEEAKGAEEAEMVTVTVFMFSPVHCLARCSHSPRSLPIVPRTHCILYLALSSFIVIWIICFICLVGFCFASLRFTSFGLQTKMQRGVFTVSQFQCFRTPCSHLCSLGRRASYRSLIGF